MDEYESPVIDNLNNIPGDEGDIISPQGVDWIIETAYVVHVQYGAVADTVLAGVFAFFLYVAVSQIDLTP